MTYKFTNLKIILNSLIFSFLFFGLLVNAYAGGASSSGTSPSAQDINPGSANTIRHNYYLRFPAAKEASPTQYGGCDQVVNGVSIGSGATVSPKSGPVSVWPLDGLSMFASMMPSQVPTWRDTSINNDMFTTYGYPVSDTQFQLIQRYNDNRLLDQMFDPEKVIWASTAISNVQSSAAANSASSMAYNQAANAINYMGAYLENFTVMANNRWSAIRNQLFIPIAILLLLPGAVLAQVRAIIAAGTPVLGQVNPFEGIFRSLIAIFMIPGTYLIMNYGIDISNSITYTIATGYSNLFGSNMYQDAVAAQKSANQQMTTSNTMANSGSSSSSAPPTSASPYNTAGSQLLMGLSKGSLSTTWNILCAFQVVYLRYLWCMGPIVAALWVWPINSLRAALPSWIEGVVVLCFWSLFWNTTIALLACFYGMTGPAVIIITALTLLANVVVAFAFNFSSMASSAGMLLMQQISKITAPGVGNAGKSLNQAAGSKAVAGKGGAKPAPTPALSPAQMQANLNGHIQLLQNATAANTYALNSGNRNPYAPLGSPAGPRVGDMGVGMIDPSYSGMAPMSPMPAGGFNSRAMSPVTPGSMPQVVNAGGILANGGFSPSQASYLSGLSLNHQVQYSPQQVNNLQHAGFNGQQIAAMQTAGIAMNGMNPAIEHNLQGLGFNPNQIGALASSVPVTPGIGMPPGAESNIPAHGGTQAGLGAAPPMTGSGDMGITPPGGLPYEAGTGFYNNGLMHMPPQPGPGVIAAGANLPPAMASQMVPMPNGEIGSMGIAPHALGYPTALNGDAVPLKSMIPMTPLEPNPQNNPVIAQQNAMIAQHNAMIAHENVASALFNNGIPDTQAQALSQFCTGQPVQYSPAEQQLLANAGYLPNQIQALEQTGFQMNGASPMAALNLEGVGLNSAQMGALESAHFNGVGNPVGSSFGPPATAAIGEYQNNVTNLEHAGFGVTEASNLAHLSSGTPLPTATSAEQGLVNNETKALEAAHYTQAQAQAIENAGIAFNPQTEQFFTPNLAGMPTGGNFDSAAFVPTGSHESAQHSGALSGHTGASEPAAQPSGNSDLPNPTGNIASAQEFQNLVAQHAREDAIANAGGTVYDNSAHMSAHPGSSNGHSGAGESATHTGVVSGGSGIAEPVSASASPSPETQIAMQYNQELNQLMTSGMSEHAAVEKLTSSSVNNPQLSEYANNVEKYLASTGNISQAEYMAMGNVGNTSGSSASAIDPYSNSANVSNYAQDFQNNLTNLENAHFTEQQAVNMAQYSDGRSLADMTPAQQAAYSQERQILENKDHYTAAQAQAIEQAGIVVDQNGNFVAPAQANNYSTYASEVNDNMKSNQTLAQAESNVNNAFSHGGSFDSATQTPVGSPGNSSEIGNINNYNQVYEQNVNDLSKYFGAAEAANMAQFSNGVPLTPSEMASESKILNGLGYNAQQIQAIENAGIRVTDQGKFIEPSALNNYSSYAQEVNNLVQNGFSIQEATNLAGNETKTPTQYTASQIQALEQQNNFNAQEIAIAQASGIAYDTMANQSNIANNQSNYDEYQSYVSYLQNTGNFSADQAQILAQYADNNPNQYSLGNMPEYSSEQITALKDNYNYTDAQIQAMENLGIPVNASGQLEMQNVQNSSYNDYASQMDVLTQAGFNQSDVAQIANDATGSQLQYSLEQQSQLQQDGYSQAQIQALETIGYQLGSNNFIESPGEAKANQEFVHDTLSIQNELNVSSENAQMLAQYATHQQVEYTPNELNVLSNHFTVKQIQSMGALGIGFKAIAKVNKLDKLEGQEQVDSDLGEEHARKSLTDQKGATLHYGKGEDAKRKKLKNYLQAQKDALDKLTKKNEDNNK